LVTEACADIAVCDSALERLERDLKEINYKITASYANFWNKKRKPSAVI
jgi:hypothetical protein